MQPRIHAITLAVEDLERALAFYRDGLGLESTGIIGAEFVGDAANPSGAVAMFHLQGGLILAVWPRSELAKDAQVPVGTPKTGEFSLGHAVASKAAVDALINPGRSFWCDGDSTPSRPPMGHLRRLLPRPRRASLGDHMEP